MEHTFRIGKRVRILLPLVGLKQEGTIYNYYPSRPWPWHVCPDGWPEGISGNGIALAESEMELLPEQQLVFPWWDSIESEDEHVH